MSWRRRLFVADDSSRAKLVERSGNGLSSQQRAVRLGRARILNIRNDLQYVATVATGGDSRYVMARMVQNTFYVTLRLNYSVTPELSIQFYGQPFLSNGRYDAFKRVRDPRAALFQDRFQAYATEEIRFDADSNTYQVQEASGRRILFVRQPRLQCARAAHQPGPALGIPARSGHLRGLEPGPRRQYRPQ